jgi:hypothetical protein
MENSSEGVGSVPPNATQPQPVSAVESYEKPVVRRIGRIRDVTKSGLGIVGDGTGGSTEV